MAPDLLGDAGVKSWMLEYHLKRIPSRESIRSSWLFAVFGPSLMNPDYWHPSRHSLALGISLGWSLGLLPVFGFHIALGLLLGILLRCHLPSVVFGTFISNPFTLPAILALQYLAGRGFISMAGADISHGFMALPLIPHILAALLMGGILSAAAAGVLGYAGLRIWLRRGRNISGRVAGIPGASTAPSRFRSPGAIRTP